jgi:FAD/FMN-containing dehydrogenase
MLFPKTTEELCRIVREAGVSGRGLVPVSSGPPHLHGASDNPGAETVCFSEMNHILRIDRKERYARVEAGVTLGELIPLVRAQGLRLNIPFLARPNKSAVTAALEREAVLLPKYQYDYPDPMLTLQVVFGTGDEFRTGSAAGPGSMEENASDKLLPWGPGSIDYQRLFSAAQGTFGFVTWGTLKAEVLPTMSTLFFIRSDSVSALTELADSLLLNRVPDECILLDRRNFSRAFSEDETEEAALESAGAWVLLCRVCGYERYPEERLAIYEGYVEDACRARGLCCERRPDFLPRPAEAYEAYLTDCDRRETWWKLRHGPHEELLLLCPPSKAGAIAEHLCERFPAAGLTLQPQVQGRAWRVEADLDGGAEAAEALFAAAPELMRLGAYFDRPYGRLPELVYTDPTATAYMCRLKKVFDPQGILNPGKLCFGEGGGRRV